MSYRYGLNKRFYSLVPASTSLSQDYVPADGEIIYLVNAGASASSAPQTTTAIIWDADGDPEYLLSTYNETNQSNINLTLTGDGVKILRIRLINDLTEVAYLGAFWQGEIL